MLHPYTHVQSRLHTLPGQFYLSHELYISQLLPQNPTYPGAQHCEFTISKIVKAARASIQTRAILNEMCN